MFDVVSQGKCRLAIVVFTIGCRVYHLLLTVLIICSLITGHVATTEARLRLLSYATNYSEHFGAMCALILNGVRMKA